METLTEELKNLLLTPTDFYIKHINIIDDDESGWKKISFEYKRIEKSD